jgi:hypothetical protein
LTQNEVVDMNGTNQAALPPEAVMIQMATAGVVSKVLYVAAKLGIADQLAAGPKAPGEIAGNLGAHSPSLYRLMRTCAGLGVLSEGEGQRFGLTPLGELLRSDHPASIRSMFLTLEGPLMSAPLDQLEHSVRTGQTSFEKVFGMGPFDYLAKHPDEARLFSETMVGFHGMEPPAVAAAYDFSSLGNIIDVGGATGNLLATILARHPQPHGVLFDLPHVVADAPARLASRGVASRVSIEAGNFFEAVPAGANAYLLSHIIHDWSEEKCLAILGNCRKAMKPSARLLIIEMVLPPGNAMHPGKLLDMIMLAIPGGNERTESEYGALLAKAGFRLSRVVPTASPVSVVEAVPA